MSNPWFKVLRPSHWVKNLFVLAPALFAQQVFEPAVFSRALCAFGLFCLLSSSVYVLNDVFDRERDQAHPLKASRPVAAGVISVSRAVVVSAVLAVVALAGAVALRLAFAGVGAGYLILNLLYSRWLKRIAYLDVTVIAAGFVLRVVGGALAIEVIISVWLVVCTFCLACLLALGKRRHELDGLQQQGVETRPALSGYSLASLRRAEWLLAGVTLLSYLLYSVAPGTVAKFGTYDLLLTLPFPVAGILRYLQLVNNKRHRTPTEALVTDAVSWLILGLWVVAVVLVLYPGWTG